MSYTDGIYEYYVGAGLSRGAYYITLRRKFGEQGSHRVKSPYLPQRHDVTEAGRDLAAYAERKKLLVTHSDEGLSARNNAALEELGGED